MHVLITGGAGFIGSRLAASMKSRGMEVTILDNLSAQVHGADAQFNSDLGSVARCVTGDVRDRQLLAREICGAEVVVHLAAETGTGQSMYAVERYSETNIQGTATLLDLIVNERPVALKKIIVASSRAVYGEGKYQCETHGEVYPATRTAHAMSAGIFEPACPHCNRSIVLLPTSEDTPFAPSSFYGLTKQVQEQMVLMFCSALNLDAIALRYQNVYGPGQSLTNPYTGLLAVFSNLVRRHQPLDIFEDGLESRDFVYIDDVVDATLSCMAPMVRGVHALNVGSGSRTTVLQVASAVKQFFDSDVPVNVTGSFRIGDIRHNVADISRIRELTGHSPRWKFDDGLKEFLKWAQLHEPIEAGFIRSIEELKERGLFGSNKLPSGDSGS